MLEIIRTDDMFQLLDFVEYSAFLRRISALVARSLGAGWETQGFNRAHYGTLWHVLAFRPPPAAEDSPTHSNHC